MKLAEGVTSKLWLWGKIFVGKIDKRIRAEDLRKRRNTIGGAGHGDGLTLFKNCRRFRSTGVLGPHGRIHTKLPK